MKETIERLEQLLSKGTPTPWWIDSHGHQMSADGGMKTVFLTDERMGPATRHPETGNLSHWPNDWDASLIVEGINALPQLLAEIRRLRAFIHDLAEGVESKRQLLASCSPTSHYITADSVLAAIVNVLKKTVPEESRTVRMCPRDDLPTVKAALLHIMQLHQDVNHVLFTDEGRWLYMSETGAIPAFTGKENLDLLQEAIDEADSRVGLPAAFSITEET